MSNINELYNLIKTIYDNNFKINILNIFLNFKDDIYIKKFENIIEKFNTIETFNDLDKYYDENYLNYKDNIKYIKLYNVLNKKNQNIILFNSNIYKDLDDLEPENNGIYINNNKTLTYKIKSQNENTKKMLNYLINEKNILSNFNEKQNKKSFIYSLLWKNDILKNNEDINLNLLNFKNNRNSKVYTELKEKYKFKRTQSIEFSVYKEKIITNVRLSLPNTIIICFNNLNFIQLNKIVISSNIDQAGLDEFKEKIEFYLNLYKYLFNINVYDLKLSFNITIKKNNITKLKYNELVYKLDKNTILFSDNNINIKYIKNIDEFNKNLNNLKIYENKFNALKNKFLNYDLNNYLLYLDNDKINKYFNL